METTARVPKLSSTSSRDSQLGGHVHQLLTLANALVRSATSIDSTETFADAGPAQEPSNIDAANANPFGVDLGKLTDRECVQWAQDLERLATIQHALSVHVAVEISQRTDAGRYSQLGVRSSVDMLVQSLSISAGEAHRRIDLGQAVLPTTDALTGEIKPAPQLLLGQAFFKGQIPQEQARQVAKFVQEASRLAQNGRISMDCRQELESTLVATAAEEHPGHLRQIGNRILSLLDPDGQKPSHADLVTKQGITFRKPRRGLVGIGGYLTVEQYEHLMVSIGRFANPNLRGTPTGDCTFDHGATPANRADATQTATDDHKDPDSAEACSNESGQERENLWFDSGPLVPDASTFNDHCPGNKANTANNFEENATLGDSKTVHGVRVPAPGSMDGVAGLDPIDPHSNDPAVRDDRTYAQKLLDGLLECVKVAARTGTLPLNGGLKAQLFISTRQEDLNATDGSGLAYTVYNGPVPLHLFDQTLCDPEVTSVTVDASQNILNVGRTQRLFTTGQRKILFARDLGCTFPDCTALPPWCEAHHVIPWHDGGETNISNAALLCSRHHTLIHHSDWSMELRGGIPVFTAPYMVDPSQRPRRNNYHHAYSTSRFP